MMQFSILLSEQKVFRTKITFIKAAGKKNTHRDSNKSEQLDVEQKISRVKECFTSVVGQNWSKN